MKQDKKQKLKKSDYAEEWFKIGDNELGFAKTGFKDNREAFYPSICFMCQQAAEKYLKGFLVFHKKRFPKIHNLVELIKLCGKIDKDFLKFLDDAGFLSQYYLVVRYPIEYKEASESEAKETIEIADKIVNFVRNKLKQ